MKTSDKGIALLVFVLSACSAVNNKLSSQAPSVTSLGTNRFSLSFFAKDLDDGSSKFQKLSADACRGRAFDINDYQTQDYSPVYVAVKGRISCK